MSARASALHRPPACDQAAVPRVAVATSSGLRRLRHLERFLDVEAVLSPREARRAGTAGDVVLVWGRKRSAERALAYAARHALPVWYLEDGWIRSAASDAHSRTCYSLLVDAEGVYYDSSAPSAIESFLNRPDEALRADVDETALDRARAARERLVAANITKYNHCPAARLPEDDGTPLVLVIDQTRDDASVRCGGMTDADFEAMLEAARSENPGARVVVRTHPDVVGGRRAGYLGEAARSSGVTLSADGDDPLPWLKRAARVYAGTSQLGYEALLCGRPVTLFGQPFYAGWGLTDDRRPIARRAHRRSVDELFHASHVHLARYVSPMNGERWSLEDCLAHVELQRREFARNARRFVCVGVTPWKRRYVAQFLRSPDGSVAFDVEATPADTRLCWGFRDHRRAAAPDVSPPWRMEDGFLRSAGLGSDFTAPGSLVIDTAGLYFDPGSPSDLEVLLNTHDCAPAALLRAGRLRRRILDSGLSKYNIGTSSKNLRKAADRKQVLVVGQVENDESIRRGCADVTTNTTLLQAVRKARPDAWIVYRPHPDVEAGNRPGRIDPVALHGLADECRAEASIGDCIDACDELHTMTSLAGFEALMRGKDVITWGAPFYAGWGLTHDHVALPRRTRRRTLDELVYLTLVLYPRYVDIASGEFVTVEDMVRIIEERRMESGASTSERGWPERQLRRAINIVRGLRYAP